MEYISFIDGLPTWWTEIVSSEASKKGYHNKAKVGIIVLKAATNIMLMYPKIDKIL